MSVLNGLFRVANRLFPAKVAYAHCDIPCGIYDPHTAQLAALTIIRMNQLMEGLARPGADASEQEQRAHASTLGRYVATKEDHAELCKKELRILWGDYFTPQHVQENPQLHELFYNAMKLASRTRQQNDMEAAQQLLSNVQDIAGVFWKTKGAELHRRPSLSPAGGELVYPVPQG